MEGFKFKPEDFEEGLTPERIAAIANAKLHKARLTMLSGVDQVYGGPHPELGLIWTERRYPTDTHAAYLIGQRLLTRPKIGI